MSKKNVVNTDIKRIMGITERKQKCSRTEDSREKDELCGCHRTHTRSTLENVRNMSEEKWVREVGVG